MKYIIKYYIKKDSSTTVKNIYCDVNSSILFYYILFYSVLFYNDTQASDSGTNILFVLLQVMQSGPENPCQQIHSPIS